MLGKSDEIRLSRFSFVVQSQKIKVTWQTNRCRKGPEFLPRSQLSNRLLPGDSA